MPIRFYGSSNGQAAKASTLYALNPSKNLFDKSATPVHVSYPDMALAETATGISITNGGTQVHSYEAYVYRIVPTSGLVGQAVTLRANVSQTGGVTPRIIIGLMDYGGTSRVSKVYTDGVGELVASCTVEEDADHPYLAVWLYLNAGTAMSGAAGQFSATYQNVMLEVGSTPTAYTPYCGPQGAAKIKALYGSVNGVSRILWKKFWH